MDLFGKSIRDEINDIYSYATMSKYETTVDSIKELLSEYNIDSNLENNSTDPIDQENINSILYSNDGFDIQFRNDLSRILSDTESYKNISIFTSYCVTIIKALLHKVNKTLQIYKREYINQELEIVELKKRLFELSEMYNNVTNLCNSYYDDSDNDTCKGSNTSICSIEKIIFNDPVTILLWSDGTKTTVRKHKRDKVWDAEKALYAAILKKTYGRDAILQISDITSKNPKHKGIDLTKKNIIK